MIIIWHTSFWKPALGHTYQFAVVKAKMDACFRGPLGGDKQQRDRTLSTYLCTTRAYSKSTGIFSYQWFTNYFVTRHSELNKYFQDTLLLKILHGCKYSGVIIIFFASENSLWVRLKYL